jgi:hypothetical protein
MLKGSATVVMVYESEIDVPQCSTLELLTSTIFRAENVLDLIELHSTLHFKHVIILHAYAAEKNPKHPTYSFLCY